MRFKSNMFLIVIILVYVELVCNYMRFGMGKILFFFIYVGNIILLELDKSYRKDIFIVYFYFGLVF